MISNEEWQQLAVVLRELIGSRRDSDAHRVLSERLLDRLNSPGIDGSAPWGRNGGPVYDAIGLLYALAIEGDVESLHTGLAKLSDLCSPASGGALRGSNPSSGFDDLVVELPQTREVFSLEELLPKRRDEDIVLREFVDRALDLEELRNG